MIILLSILVGVLTILSVIMAFAIYNLLNKNEKQEDILSEYLKYLDSISRVIEISDTKLKKLDARGTFKSDDEVGFFFKNIQTIQELLNEFKIKKY
jgi:hypothetical protein